MFNRVRELKAKGLNKTEIARELGINWKTVTKYLESNTPPQYKARSVVTREDPLKEFLPRLVSLIETMPRLSEREAFEYLWSEGYRGSERTVNRRLRKTREGRSKERFFEQEYAPGEQAQFDFKEKVPIKFLEGERIVYLHFSTLPHSDTCRVRGYPSTNFECYMDGIHSFFESLGGMTKNIRIDNLSACVTRVLKHGDRIWTGAFKRAMTYYGFGVLACSPGKGNEKGDVERDIQTRARRIKNQIQIQNLVFKNWDHLNEWLHAFCLQLENDETKEALAKEQKHLLPLAARDENILCRTETTPASSYGTVRFIKSTYSVPDCAIGLLCRLVPGPYTVCIYRGKDLIATHPRMPTGENSVLLEHVISSLVRKPRAMIRWTHRNILFPNPSFKELYVRLQKLDSATAEREFLKSMNLIHYANLSDLLVGVELVLEQHRDHFFEHLKELVLGPSNLICLPRQKPIDPNLTDYDVFIPQPQQKENL